VPSLARLPPSPTALPIPKMGTVHLSNSLPIPCRKTSIRSCLPQTGGISLLSPIIGGESRRATCEYGPDERRSAGGRQSGGRAEVSKRTGRGRWISANGRTELDRARGTAEVGRSSTATLRGGAIWGRWSSGEVQWPELGGRGEAMRGRAIWGWHSETLLDSPRPHPRWAPAVSECGSGVCWVGLSEDVSEGSSSLQVGLPHQYVPGSTGSCFAIRTI
jgi:hypothetical protein